MIPFGNEPEYTEHELLLKLVTTQHLNVPERRALPGGKARASLLCVAIARALESAGWLPPLWKLDEPFDGGLIELKPDGTCRIHWKAEVACMRFESMGVQECATLHEAAIAWLKATFSRGDIDGIPIEWDV